VLKRTVDEAGTTAPKLNLGKLSAPRQIANQCEGAALPKLICEAGSAHIPIAYQRSPNRNWAVPYFFVTIASIISGTSPSQF